MENREDYDEEISLFEYLNVIIKRKVLVIIIILISVSVTAFITFRSPKIYQATAVIIPASQPTQQTGMSALATQFGISTTPVANVSELVKLLKSNILMERVLERRDLLSIFFKKENLAEMTAEAKIWNGIRNLQSIFTVNHNQREGVIELSAEFTDPKIAADIINYMLSELTDYMSSEAKRVAESNRKYLESLIEKNSDPLIRQKIYSLVAQQIETSMMAEVKENFAFKVIDPPKAPDRKIKPKIKKTILLSFVVSLLAGIFIALFVEYIGKTKWRERLKNEKE